MEIESIQWLDIIQPENVVALIGVLLLVSGAKLYRLSIMTPGFICGIYIASQWVEGSVELQLGAALLLGVLGSIVMLLLEKLAIAMTGAIAGGGITLALSPYLASSGELEWYWPFIGGFFGALVFPVFFKRILPLATSIIGALCIAWPIEEQNNFPLIAGLTLAGVLLQLLLSRGAKSSE